MIISINNSDTFSERLRACGIAPCLLSHLFADILPEINQVCPPFVSCLGGSLIAFWILFGVIQLLLIPMMTRRLLKLQSRSEQCSTLRKTDLFSYKTNCVHRRNSSTTGLIRKSNIIRTMLSSTGECKPPPI